MTQTQIRSSRATRHGYRQREREREREKKGLKDRDTPTHSVFDLIGVIVRFLERDRGRETEAPQVYKECVCVWKMGDRETERHTERERARARESERARENSRSEEPWKNFSRGKPRQVVSGLESTG